MLDDGKTRRQLIEELQEARTLIAELEGAIQPVEDKPHLHQPATMPAMPSEERLNRILEQMPYPVEVTDRDGIALFVNEAFLDMFGIPSSDLVVGRFNCFNDPFLKKLGLCEYVRRVYRGETVCLADVALPMKLVGKTFQGRDERTKYVEITMFPVLSKSGDLGQVVTIWKDITRQKMAEEALRESEERLRTVFNSTGDYLMMLDRDHRVQMINRLEPGLSRDEVVGRPLYALLPPGKQEDNKRLLDTAVKENTRLEYHTSYLRPDGNEVHFSSIVAPIVVEGKTTGSVVSSRDITDLRLLEKEKQLIEEKYRHSQRMEAIGRLAGGVAHDFNNVLCTIMGNATLALQDLSDGDPLRTLIESIAEAANRASNMTQQLLAFSRKQVIAPKNINLSHVIESLHPMLVRLIGEDVVLRTEPAQGLGLVRVDLSQVEQIVLNLAINSRDAMPEGGELLIETANVFLNDTSGESQSEVGSAPYVMLSVTDSGHGISAEIRDKIFEPFFTTKQLGRGTGLGLAMVYGIVEQSGGRIDVDSEPGTRTSFKVYFPRVTEATEPFPVSKATEPTGGQEIASARGRETVLLVEDDEMIRSVAVRFLTHLGYDTLVAGSGDEAIKMAEGYDKPIDLLFTDVVMPVMSGCDLYVKIVKKRPGIKVLYTSGYDRDLMGQHNVGGDDRQFIGKPYSLHALAVRLRDVLDQK